MPLPNRTSMCLRAKIWSAVENSFCSVLFAAQAFHDAVSCGGSSQHHQHVAHASASLPDAQQNDLLMGV